MFAYFLLHILSKTLHVVITYYYIGGLMQPVKLQIKNRNINFRAPAQLVEELYNMIEKGEARNLSDAVRVALDRYFRECGRRESCGR